MRPIIIQRSKSMPVRAGIFTRTQLNERGEVINDPAQQEETCRRHANKQGYVVTQVYRDETVSVDAERPELRKLRTSIWTRKLDVVIATTPDRLYVDTNRLAKFAKEADLMNVRIEFVNDPLAHEYLLHEDY
jgi:DNA invertase Pin-like site-specific DNA recombinase